MCRSSPATRPLWSKSCRRPPCTSTICKKSQRSRYVRLGLVPFHARVAGLAPSRAASKGRGGNGERVACCSLVFLPPFDLQVFYFPVCLLSCTLRCLIKWKGEEADDVCMSPIARACILPGLSTLNLPCATHSTTGKGDGGPQAAEQPAYGQSHAGVEWGEDNVAARGQRRAFGGVSTWSAFCPGILSRGIVLGCSGRAIVDSLVPSLLASRAYRFACAFSLTSSRVLSGRSVHTHCLFSDWQGLPHMAHYDSRGPPPYIYPPHPGPSPHHAGSMGYTQPQAVPPRAAPPQHQGYASSGSAPRSSFPSSYSGACVRVCIACAWLPAMVAHHIGSARLVLRWASDRQSVGIHPLR